MRGNQLQLLALLLLIAIFLHVTLALTVTKSHSGGFSRVSFWSSSCNSRKSTPAIRPRLLTFAVYSAADDDADGGPGKEDVEAEAEAEAEAAAPAAEDAAPAAAAAIEEDPQAQQMKEMEKKLAQQVADLESALRSERLNLAKVKDQVSESGKNGFFIVQAQVAEFLKKNDNQQKQRVVKNKRDFVIQMLSVVDGFRAAPVVAPAVTEREETMHKTFSSLLTSILTVFDKYGFKEIEAEAGERLDPTRHEVGAVEAAVGGEVGVVVRQMRSGWVDGEGDVVRKILVAGSSDGGGGETSPEAEASAA